MQSHEPGIRSLKLTSTQTMQTDFLSIRVMIVSSLTLGTFLMHRIRNVLANRVLKKPLGDHSTWLLSGRQSRIFTRSLCLQLPSTDSSLLMVCVYHAAKQKNLVKHGGDWKYSI
jgi:hypothetical protein